MTGRNYKKKFLRSRRLRGVLVVAPLLLFPFAAPAQEQDASALPQLFQQYQSAARAGEYSKAEQLAMRMLTITQRVDENHVNHAISLRNLANVYRNLGRYAEAIPLYLKAIAIEERQLGSKHIQLAGTLANLAVLYRLQSRYAEAISLLTRSLQISEKQLGSENPGLASIMTELATIHQEQGNFSEATALQSRALAIQEKAFGSEHLEVAISLFGLAVLYQSQGRYADAARFAARALAIQERSLGLDHPDVASSLNLLGLVHKSRGQFAEGIRFFTRALTISEKSLGAEHVNVALILVNLANTYQAQGHYNEAAQVHGRALAILENAHGPNHPDVAKSLNGLAMIYSEQGRNHAAIKLFSRALEIFEKSLGSRHIAVATVLNNISTAYQSEGRFSDAIPLQMRSLAIRESALGTNHGEVAESLNNLAMLYLHSGRKDEAIALLHRSITVIEKTYGPSDHRLATSLVNKALILNSYGCELDAVPLLERALTIREAALGPDHPNVAETLINMGDAHKCRQDYVAAVKNFQRALEIWERMFGPGHPRVAVGLMRLAAMHETYNRYDEAKQLTQRALEIEEAALGSSHANIAVVLHSLAILEIKQKHWNAALSHLRRLSSLRGVGAGGSAPIGEGYNGPLRYGYFNLILAAWEIASAENVERRDALSHETFEYGQMVDRERIVQSIAQMAVRFTTGNDLLRRSIRNRQDLIGELGALDKQLTAAISADSDKRDEADRVRAKLKTLEARIAELDAQLAREFPDFTDMLNPMPVTMVEAKELLSADEALVVLVGAVQRDELFVWTLSRESAIWRRTELHGKELPDKLAAFRRGLDRKACRAGRGLARADEPDPACTSPETLPFDLDLAHDLYKTLLGPVESVIKDKKHLIIVPSGPLTSLPFDVLVTEKPLNPRDYANAQWLAKRHAITILPAVSSLKALRTFAKGGQAGEPYIGIGDPVFQRGSQDAKPKAGEQIASTRGFADYFRGSEADLDLLEEGLAPLPGTAVELKAVARTLRAKDADVITGRAASETTVKRLSEEARLARYRVVHFATHALVAGELKGLAEPALALSLPAAPSEADDGLLTASEVAGLKLNADWVVLSACNTAAGDKPGAEALSGLAKAFFYAGARALLVSHWPVEDQAGAFLVTHTFKELAEHPKIGRSEALRRAQLALMQQSPHPALWAPYMVVGEGGADRK